MFTPGLTNYWCLWVIQRSGSPRREKVLCLRGRFILWLPALQRLTWPFHAADVHSSTPLPLEEINVVLKWIDLYSLASFVLPSHFLLSLSAFDLFIVGCHFFGRLRETSHAESKFWFFGGNGISPTSSPFRQKFKEKKSDNSSDVSNISLIHSYK